MTAMLSEVGAWLGSDAVVTNGLLLMAAIAFLGLMWHARIPVLERIRLARALNAAARADAWPPTTD